MALKSFGCSFIFGSELSDQDNNYPGLFASNLTWPAQLAQAMNLDYECHARPGSGNLQIAEKVLLQLEHSTPHDFFVIGWSWIDRFDYKVSTDNSKHNGWHTILPGDTDSTSKNYYRDLHSEYRDKFTNLIYINTVLNQLQQYKIPFIMTYMDDLLFDQQWHINKAIQQLQHNVRPHMIDFEGYNFLDWSRKNNYPVSDLWHPLDQAHMAAAKHVLEHHLQHKFI